MTKKYKVIKDFSLADLYNAGCPIDIFEKVFKEYADFLVNDFYYNYFGGIEEDVIELPDFIKSNAEWFISTGYIEEIEKDIELLPGMILENERRRQLIVTTKGIFSLSGWSENGSYLYTYNTLNELNNDALCTWRIIND